MVGARHVVCGPDRVGGPSTVDWKGQFQWNDIARMNEKGQEGRVGGPGIVGIVCSFTNLSKNWLRKAFFSKNYFFLKKKFLLYENRKHGFFFNTKWDCEMGRMRIERI